MAETAEWLGVALSHEPAEANDLYSDSQVTITPAAAIASIDALREEIEDFLKMSTDHSEED
jgi:hypothetical protein